jgi:short-subunit dehydrogenase involved in D-alanine esterification of teichoic acids
MPGIVTCDLSRESEIDALSVKLLRGHPDLNILINNAGVQFHYHLLDDAHVPTRMTEERQGKMATSESVTNACIDALARDQYEIRVGKVKLLFTLNRWLPGLAERIIRNSP